MRNKSIIATQSTKIIKYNWPNLSWGFREPSLRQI